jgi:quinol monooxygenase YgiN
MKSSKLLLSLIFVLAVFNFTSADAQSNKNLVVLVKYKTQAGKDSIALVELKNLVAKVKKEPNYVTIIIHVDPSDKSNILLYEQWSDEEYYKGEHMKTVHLQQFMTDARLFLAGPPEITFWKTDN